MEFLVPVHTEDLECPKPGQFGVRQPVDISALTATDIDALLDGEYAK
jgi:hypothetical protein